MALIYKLNEGIPGLVEIVEGILMDDCNVAIINEVMRWPEFRDPLKYMRKKYVSESDYRKGIENYLELVEKVYGDLRYCGKFKSPNKKILIDYKRFSEPQDEESEREFKKEFGLLSDLLCSIKDAIKKCKAGYITTKFYRAENFGEELYRKKRVIYTPRDDCFVVTACIESQGLSKDCRELELMRFFRDNFVRQMAGGNEMIDLYYSTAPQVVTDVRQRGDRQQIFNSFYQKEVVPIANLIEVGNFEDITHRYVQFFRRFISYSKDPNAILGLPSFQRFLNGIDKLNKIS